MVNFPPYLPSSGWYAAWLKHVAAGHTDPEAISCANASTLSDGRPFARAILTANQNEPFMLSIAIEGGGRNLRNLNNVRDFPLSNHGNWQKNHLGALDAIYGKTPFFSHLISLLKPVYQNDSISTLEQFNLALHNEISGFLTCNITPDNLISLGSDPLLKQRSREISGYINCNISIVDALMRIGPETLIGMVAL